MRGGRRERANSNCYGSPLAGPIGDKVAADSGVKLSQERFVERVVSELFGLNSGFQTRDAFAQNGS
ncbi:MAG TPA: hypothetical protein VK633_00310 [Verrucomicrobiae bacterium]|nr:hypothetical protein [Verrucomicrobiae bacterium]